MRTIIKEPHFEQQFQSIESDTRRADEFIEGTEWTLARDPTVGSQVRRDSNVWFLPMSDVPNQPPLILYYTFNSECVWFLSIQIAP